MATSQISVSAPCISTRISCSTTRMPSIVKFASISTPQALGISQRSSRNLLAKAATVVAPKYTAIKPLADRVLVKICKTENVTEGGILLPESAQTKSQVGEVLEIGEGKKFGNKRVKVEVKVGSKVVYSKYVGTELEFKGSNHIILKEEDIVGVLETEDIKDLKPLSDRVLIKVSSAADKTAGGVLLTDASKEKPCFGTVIAVGPGSHDDEGNRKAVSVSPGSTVLYSKYAGTEFEGKDGLYVIVRASDVIAALT